MHLISLPVHVFGNKIIYHLVFILIHRFNSLSKRHSWQTALAQLCKMYIIQFRGLVPSASHNNHICHRAVAEVPFLLNLKAKGLGSRSTICHLRENNTSNERNSLLSKCQRLPAEQNRQKSRIHRCTSAGSAGGGGGVSRESVSTLSTVGTSVTHRPAKARLEPRLGLGPAPTRANSSTRACHPHRPQRKPGCPAASGAGKGPCASGSSWKPLPPLPSHGFAPAILSAGQGGRPEPYLRTRPSLPRY